MANIYIFVANVLTHYCFWYLPFPQSFCRFPAVQGSRLCQGPSMSHQQLLFPSSASQSPPQHLQFDLSYLMAAQTLKGSCRYRHEMSGEECLLGAVEGNWGIPSCLAFQAGKLRHFLPWPSGFLSGVKLRLPMAVACLVMCLFWHPFLSFLTSPGPHKVFPEITSHINSCSSWNYWGLDCRVPLHANFFQSMQSAHPIHRFDHQQTENSIPTFPSAISQSQLPKPGLYMLFLNHECEGPNIESKAPLTPTLVKGQSRVYF